MIRERVQHRRRHRLASQHAVGFACMIGSCTNQATDGGQRMTCDEFREIEAALAVGHADMAAQLGVSEVSVKRYATGAMIPEHIARLMVALLVISKRHHTRAYNATLARYLCDT